MGTFKPVLGKRIRVTKLDDCGRPADKDKDDQVVVTGGFVSVSLSSETEDGEEIIQKTANGDLCVNERLSDSFKRFTVELSLCGVNPELLSLLTNADVYEGYDTGESGDDSTSSGIVIKEGKVDTNFALELWTGLSGAQCKSGVEEASGYLLLPFVNSGVLGDLEVTGDDAIDFSISNAFTKSGNGWGEGPYRVLGDMSDDELTAKSLPSELDEDDHLLLIDTGIAPPPSKSGTQSIDDADHDEEVESEGK